MREKQNNKDFIIRVRIACVQTSPISFASHGKGTREAKEIGDVCTQARFVQSLEFLKKYGNLQTSFPDLEKVWKKEIKSAKMERTLEFCSIL